ncbi:hypothetical protein E8E12_003805 [Didymella heteroderae]|uniref:Uncharacterized protein n=1 Tax=Didymella heteroderae TaxID=1769908 RepID=A0A9P5C1E6_9PLEO|nr:hypothetical protein E8E12_003805 [Didymella heteroderae]
MIAKKARDTGPYFGPGLSVWEDEHGELTVKTDWKLDASSESDDALDQTTLILLASHNRGSKLHGLLIHPLPDGKYVRVGQFDYKQSPEIDTRLDVQQKTSRQDPWNEIRHGNLGVFQDATFKNFHIV